MSKYAVFVCPPRVVPGMMEYLLDRVEPIEADTEADAKVKYVERVSGWLREDEKKWVVTIAIDILIYALARKQAKEYMERLGWS